MTSRRVKQLLGGAAGLALAYHVVIGFGTYPAAATAPDLPARQAANISVNPERDAFFGDLHVHTTNSFDAYVTRGTRVGPDESYRFARGEEIDFFGQKVHREVPLDFQAVTDHSENLGVFNQLDDPNTPFALTEVGKLAKAGGYANFLKIVELLSTAAGSKAAVGENAPAVSASAWRRSIEATNANYVPGKFTTFIGYEYTSMPGLANLHRNVIFRGSNAPTPFSKFDSENPADLWAWLGKIRGQGFDALAIAHNANASNGLMYDWNTLDGRPIDEAWAQLRATNEPLSEISQNKGQSETHPLLSANDEFAGFERWDKLLLGGSESKKPGSYWRDALGRGLTLQAKLGVNPYKDGAIGSGDLHNGVSVSSEKEFAAGSANLGGSRRTREQSAVLLGVTPPPAGTPASVNQSTVSGSPGLAGVWAESNTRESIFAALRRKETFATSGTRIKLRFFAGWNFAPNLLSQPNWVKTAYAGGVPMGGDLPAARGKAPSFVVQAVKDPNSGNLDRIQIVKVWLEQGKQQERVFDVAWSGDRRIDPATGKLPAVGDTVDLKTGKYANSIGAAQLSVLWKDPSFRADQAAVYYVRVLEIPTPRWTTLLAIEHGLPLAKDSPATIQERAWSSPIWFTPKRG